MNPQQPDSSENISVVKGSKLHMKRLKSVKETNEQDEMFRNFSVGLTPVLPPKNSVCD